MKLQTSDSSSQSETFPVASGATVFVEIVTVNSNNKAYNFMVSVYLDNSTSPYIQQVIEEDMNYKKIVSVNNSYHVHR